MKKCIILMSNMSFIQKAKETIRQIRQIGEYTEDIVLLIGDDLKKFDKLNNMFSDDRLIIKYFPTIDRSKEIEIYKNTPISDGREINKTFQFHKIHCFDIYFKQWDVCFYIDAGMQIFKPIDKFFKLDYKNSLIAHNDDYPFFKNKLNCQFNKDVFPELYNELENEYSLNIDYFQSGVMIYDTNIIEENTKNILLEMSKKWINSRTNEQGIMNLLFNSDYMCWKQLQIKDNDTYFYDYWERDNLKYTDYIMLKYTKTK